MIFSVVKTVVMCNDEYFVRKERREKLHELLTDHGFKKIHGNPSWGMFTLSSSMLSLRTEETSEPISITSPSRTA
jgi:6-phosphogluconolactonase/glucosamine-6-phosphate isomerase/deaminase